ncbi:proline-rich protein HaeIII subfamily 1-like [Ursus arctos]|uniref:proline-rich protein HaeIII subfamily 1-like n=1 Tax=Ursus arctos TaxID=9644 RepID=UPI0025496213|nr:proline-rich protein HaeIII subfamily 1-like [Ursus arctos]
MPGTPPARPGASPTPSHGPRGHRPPLAAPAAAAAARRWPPPPPRCSGDARAARRGFWGPARGRPTWAAGLTWPPCTAGGSGPRRARVPASPRRPRGLAPFAEDRAPPPRKPRAQPPPVASAPTLWRFKSPEVPPVQAATRPRAPHTQPPPAASAERSARSADALPQPQASSPAPRPAAPPAGLVRPAGSRRGAARWGNLVAKSDRGCSEATGQRDPKPFRSCRASMWSQACGIQKVHVSRACYYKSVNCA